MMSTMDEVGHDDAPREDVEEVDGAMGKLFEACDLDGSGFIDKNELSMICTELTPVELSEVFKSLDSDGDGKISINEFAVGFRAIRDTMLENTKDKIDRKRKISYFDLAPTKPSAHEGDGKGGGGGRGGWNGGRDDAAARQGRANERRKSLFDLVGSLDEGFTALTCQDQICELYQELHEAGLNDVVNKFEEMVVTVIKDVHQKQCENERLERSYKREKEQHARHLQQLEEDTETQAHKVESRVRKEEREKYETEKEELKAEYELELSELQTNLKRLQEQAPIQFEKPSDDQKTKSRLDEVLLENRSMKRQLNDAETSLALVRGEVASLKSLLKETTISLETEKSTLTEYLKDHENLSRQVQALQDVNKKLHDTNDAMAEALESARINYKRPHSVSGRSSMLRSISTGSRGEYVRKYLDSTDPESASQVGVDRTNGNGPESLADELNMISGGHPSTRHLLPTQDSFEVDGLAEDIDIRDDESDDDEELALPRKRNRGHARDMFRMSSRNGSELLTESFEEGGAMGGIGGVTGLDDMEGTGGTQSRCLSSCSYASSRLGSDYFHNGSSKHSGGGGGSVRRGFHSQQTLVGSSAANTAAPLPAPVVAKAQEPERVFKIVLAGDAAVGKSSFIMRLCKNKFVANLNSTLGVDFQTKTLEVDGRCIALQLWDTAGQERFRSIAKSYFRRADGVLLLYDVTYERSFLSVRDWLETIEEGAQKQIPIMLVGNKRDMRTVVTPDDGGGGDSNKTGVKTEEGQRLAKEFLGLFIETSAKDGSNVLEAVTELTRMLMTNEDLEVQSIGLKLQDVDVAKKKSPCCNI